MMQDGTQNTNRWSTRRPRSASPASTSRWASPPRSWPSATRSAREDQDAYGLQSQQRYAAAVEKGYIKEEIAPMKVRRAVMKKGEEPYEEDFVVEKDECNRPRPRSRASPS